jgi:soluble lytic murein transglycosylase
MMISAIRMTTRPLVLLSVVFTLLVSLMVARPMNPLTSSNAAAELPAEPKEPPSPRTEDEAFEGVVFDIAATLAQHNQEFDGEEVFSLAEFIVNKSHQMQIDPYMTLAIIRVESTFDPCALSKKGARGLMQVMPTRILGHEEVYERYAFNHHKIYDPIENMTLGLTYFRSLVDRFGCVERAITAYNLGPTRLSRVLRTRGELKTRYTKKVLQQYEALVFL